MARVTAGARDRKVRIERASITRDAMNAPVETWGELATVFAAKHDLTDVERLRADQLSAPASARFVFPWSARLAGLNARDQLVCEGLRYQVTGVRELGRRVDLEVSATSLGR